MRKRRQSTIIVWSIVVCACGGGSGGSPTPTAPTVNVADSGDGTLLLQRLPIDLTAVDFALVVSRREGRDPDWRPLEDYGRVFPANSARPTSATNPQPTFLIPIHQASAKTAHRNATNTGMGSISHNQQGRRLD